MIVSIVVPGGDDSKEPVKSQDPTEDTKRKNLETVFGSC